MMDVIISFRRGAREEMVQNRTKKIKKMQQSRNPEIQKPRNPETRNPKP